MVGHEQQTIEWRRERLGRVTASKFDAVMLGPKSAQYVSYARQLRREAEILKRLNAGEDVPPDPEFYSAPLAWGRKHESMARARYELEMNCDISVPTFRVHPEFPFVGCSPDGETDGGVGLELKCPWIQEIHATTLVSGMPLEHKAQVQGQIWVCNYGAVDFVSFDPRRTDGHELALFRQYPDSAYLLVLIDAIMKFWDFVQSGQDTPKVHIGGAVPRLF